MNHQLHHHQIPANQFRHRKQPATGQAFKIKKASQLPAISLPDVLNRIQNVLHHLIQKLPDLRLASSERFSSMLMHVRRKMVLWLLSPVFQLLIFIYRKIVTFLSSSADTFFSFMDEFFLMDEPSLQMIAVNEYSPDVNNAEKNRQRISRYFHRIPQNRYAFFTINPSHRERSITNSSTSLSNDHKHLGSRFFDRKTTNPDSKKLPWWPFRKVRRLFVLPLFKNALKLPFTTQFQHVRSILSHCPKNLFAALDPVFADTLHRDNTGC